MKKNIIVGTFIIFFALSLYLYSSAPTIIFSDSPDHTVCSFILGVPHPSGYPLYTLIGRLFCLLPLGNVGLRVNFASSVISITTLFLLFLLLRKVGLNLFTSVLATLIFSLSFTFWRIAYYAKIYSLYAFFSIALLLCAYSWSIANPKKKKNLLYLGGFLLGASFTNHNLTATLFLPLLIFIGKELFSKLSSFLKIIGLAILGFSVYIYLPIRSATKPIIDWACVNSISRFFDCMLIRMAAEKQILFFMEEKENLLARIIEWYFPLLWKQFYIFLFFVPIGLFWFFLKNKKFFLLLTLIYLCNAGYSLSVGKIFRGVRDMEAFHLPSFLVLGIFAAAGIYYVFTHPRIQKLKIVLSFIFLFLPMLSLFSNFYKANMRKYYFSSDFASNILRQLPPFSILFNNIDLNILPLWYNQYVERQREDVASFPVLFLTRYWFVKRLLEEYNWIKVNSPIRGSYEDVFYNLVFSNLDKLPIYYTFNKDFEEEKITTPLKERLEKEGLLWRIKDKNFKEKKEFKSFVFRGIFEEDVYKDVWAQEIMYVYSYYWADLGEYFLQKNRIKEAIYALEKSLKFDPSNATYRIALANVYQRAGKYKEAEECIKVGLNYSVAQNLRAILHYQLAVSLFYSKDYKSAWENLNKAFDLGLQLEEGIILKKELKERLNL